MAAGLAWLAFAVPSADGQAQTVSVVEQFGDWSLYAELPDKTLCFVATVASEGTAKTSGGEPAVLYISAWPKDGVKAEISVRSAQKLKKSAETAITVGTSPFRMFSRDDRAFVDDPTRELKLIDAMKKGAKAVFRGELERGGAVTETFALGGFAQALQALAKTCP